MRPPVQVELVKDHPVGAVVLIWTGPQFDISVSIRETPLRVSVEMAQIDPGEHDSILELRAVIVPLKSPLGEREFVDEVTGRARRGPGKVAPEAHDFDQPPKALPHMHRYHASIPLMYGRVDHDSSSQDVFAARRRRSSETGSRSAGRRSSIQFPPTPISRDASG